MNTGKREIMKTDFIQIFISFPDKKSAEKCTKLLLEKKLAGCVQLFPIKSSFRWNGKIEKVKEYLCLVKTKRVLFSKIARLVKESHPYTVPEIISCPITDGNKDYLDWLENETNI